MALGGIASVARRSKPRAAKHPTTDELASDRDTCSAVNARRTTGAYPSWETVSLLVVPERAQEPFDPD